MKNNQATIEGKRLSENYTQKGQWLKWGPYLSERQWGTVREDYSEHGTAWDSFPHDHARSRVYRWGEDGLAGISDDLQRQYTHLGASERNSAQKKIRQAASALDKIERLLCSANVTAFYDFDLDATTPLRNEISRCAYYTEEGWGTARGQYARLVRDWVTSSGLEPSSYGTHSMRRTKVAEIYRKTGSLRAVQLLLGHTKMDSTVRYLGVELEDALAIAEAVEI